MNTTYLLSLVSGYLIGSVSFALLLAKLQGIDLREVGSGNLGATNAGRALGKKYGVLVYLLDMLKGALPVLAAKLFFAADINIAVLVGMSAYLGHIWPLYLGFKGGKGVATTAGVLAVVSPMASLAGAVSWLLVYSMSKKSSSMGEMSS
jgi:glycerol-3-phosphate acyltransferase PlsY